MTVMTKRAKIYTVTANGAIVMRLRAEDADEACAMASLQTGISFDKLSAR